MIRRTNLYYFLYIQQSVKHPIVSFYTFTFNVIYANKMDLDLVKGKLQRGKGFWL